MLSCAREPRWWNRQTRGLEGAVPQGVGVQISSSAPKNDRTSAWPAGRMLVVRAHGGRRDDVRGKKEGKNRRLPLPPPSIHPPQRRRAPGRRSQVARQGSAKPPSPVRIRSSPPTTESGRRTAAFGRAPPGVVEQRGQQPGSQTRAEPCARVQGAADPGTTQAVPTTVVLKQSALLSV